ncbi:MAG: PEGA domain-containing protein, partial [Ignavibacteriae bacterium]|nr:PEGA domain-containing protein [Ignavibacteriota bacterium]
TISTAVNPNEAGSVSGSGDYDHGSLVNLIATPNIGYSFVNWTEDGNEVSINSNYSFTALTDRNLVANFEENGNINVNSDPTGADVYLNNIFTGQTTPHTIENLVKGEYSITLKLDDFADTTIVTDVFSGQTTNLGTIFLRDTTSAVEVNVTYSVNSNQQLIFTFKFNQDIRFNRVTVTRPDGTPFPQNYSGVLLPEGIGINWTYPEKIVGEWKFVFVGSKVWGRQQDFEVTEFVDVL